MGSPKELFKVVLGRKQGPQRNQALVLFRMGCQSEGMCRLYAAWRHPMRSHCRTRRITLLYPCYTLSFRSLLGALVPSLYCFLPFFFHSLARHAGFLHPFFVYCVRILSEHRLGSSEPPTSCTLRSESPQLSCSGVTYMIKCRICCCILHLGHILMTARV